MTQSKVKWVRLGDYIEQVERRNSDEIYGVDYVRGVSNTKQIQKTKANLEGRSFAKFHIVLKSEFVFNRRTTRNGERIGLGYNDTEEVFIFTEDYVHFKVIDPQTLDPTFLYLFFMRDEFDRYARYQSWGSATEFFYWEEMVEVSIPLPSITRQREIVETWQGLRKMKE